MRPPRVPPPCSGGLPTDQHRGRSIPTSRPPPCSGSGRGASRPRCSGRRSGATAPPPRPPGRRHAPGGTRAPSSQRLCTAASCAGDAHVRASGVLRPPPPPATPSSGFAFSASMLPQHPHSYLGLLVHPCGHAICRTYICHVLWSCSFLPSRTSPKAGGTLVVQIVVACLLACFITQT